MARRHNTVTYARPDTTVLAGVMADLDTESYDLVVTYIEGAGKRCDGCGYLLRHCGCPGSPRVLNGAAG